MIRKAKPYQRSRWPLARDRTPSQTQVNSPCTVPQAQEHHTKEQEQQGSLRRSKRRSASASPPTGQIKADTLASHNEGKGQRKSRRPARLDDPDTDQTVRQSSRSRTRSRSKSRSNSEGFTPPSQPRGRRPVSMEQHRSSNTKNATVLLADTDQTAHQSSQTRTRSGSKTRSGSEGFTPPSLPRGRRPASVEQQHSSNTKTQDPKRTKRTPNPPNPPTPVASQSPPEPEQQVMGPPKSRARRGGRKKMALALEDNVTDISMSDKDSISQKRKPRSRKGANIKETTEEVDSSKWTAQELQSLHE